MSPKSRHLHQGYGPGALSEHLYSPLRLTLSRINVFSTLMALDVYREAAERRWKE